MNTFEDRQRRGRHGTDLPSYAAVQGVVTRLVRKYYAGWSASDREDLEQIVLAKYFRAFGRDRLPDDPFGLPAVPIPWLTAVVKNAGTDLHRMQLVRPADPVDFNGPDFFGLERLLGAVNSAPSLSSAVAQRVDVERLLEALGDAYPSDLNLIRWRYIEDCDLEVVAGRAGKSLEATKKAVQRAVKRLRDLMPIIEADRVN
ncbi:sigma-70 family RNA polymerase sigma factor [Cryobacterium zongtaii]|uniref:sigma-70 family RNA polymerase sigma factor n=1 Tax=Cryobacterium zongtaii TaxID=1259217 RepID=UPI00105730A4|nr:sigma-70 family RNA polymerase sigma factor [Cryobacterium zongtaii]